MFDSSFATRPPFPRYQVAGVRYSSADSATAEDGPIPAKRPGGPDAPFRRPANGIYNEHEQRRALQRAGNRLLGTSNLLGDPQRLRQQQSSRAAQRPGAQSPGTAEGSCRSEGSGEISLMLGGAAKAALGAETALLW